MNPTFYLNLEKANIFLKQTFLYRKNIKTISPSLLIENKIRILRLKSRTQAKQNGNTAYFHVYKR